MALMVLCDSDYFIIAKRITSFSSWPDKAFWRIFLSSLDRGHRVTVLCVLSATSLHKISELLGHKNEVIN